MAEIDYPAKLSIDYPDRKLNRLSTFFRIFYAIPILIIVYLVVGASSGWREGAMNASLSAGGFLIIPTILMLLFRRKYPRWWFDWNFSLTKFSYRVNSYLSLLSDVYPSTDEDQNVRVDISYPNTQTLNRWLPLVKWFLAIPHYIVLIFLWLASFVLWIIALFAILFTGKYPRGIFDFIVGVMRWTWRVSFYGYAALGTDKYPPFSLKSGGYPADLEVAYPEKLSKGLVLVKWWLLALPQYAVVCIFQGGLGAHCGGLILVMVIFGAVVLLFKGKYPRDNFDFAMGMNRWSYRVFAYAALTTDKYPPFRLSEQ
jgi:hypothetical protein